MKTNKEKIEALDFALDTRLSPEVKALLTGVNALGIRIETMSAQDARHVFATVQASVNVDLSGIEESERMGMEDPAHHSRGQRPCVQQRALLCRRSRDGIAQASGCA